MKDEIIKLVDDARAFMQGRQTDLICLVIERNPDFLRRYMHAVGEAGGKTGWGDVNRAIGDYVKESVKGENDFREYTPMSTLLQSFTVFKDNG